MTITSLNTGKIIGYSTENDTGYLLESTNDTKIFCTLKPEMAVQEIEKMIICDKQRLVFVINENDVYNSLDEIIEMIHNFGFEVAFRISFCSFPGLITIKRWNPSFIILDRSVVSHMKDNIDFVHKVNSVVIFGRELNYTVIAEGIDSKKELQDVIDIGIPYGSGIIFYSDRSGTKCADNVVKVLEEVQKQKEQQNISMIKNVGAICQKCKEMLPDEKATTAYELFKKDKESSVICIVDEDNNFNGILTKTELMQIFSGRYGFNLHRNDTVMKLVNKTPLIVYRTFSIENVSHLAMERDISELYDPVVVIDQDKYYGIVTVKDLLSTAVYIEVERANDTNPLTALPGNRAIEHRIQQLIGEESYFAILYLDLDNFKAFNDAYGFSKGDCMIEMLAEVIKWVYGSETFLGHVGGDDFVIITRRSDVREQAERIIEEFKKNVVSLYNNTDLERGYIVAKNRKGVTEHFPIASVSIAVVTNQSGRYEQLMELMEKVVKAKKKAKQIEGNSIYVI